MRFATCSGFQTVRMIMVAMLCAAAAACASQRIAPSTVAAPSMADYRLSAGDKVSVITYNEPSLTLELTVGPEGNVDMPLIGAVPAAGKTGAELGAAIQNALAQGFVRDPKVSVQLQGARPYYILGEVRQPGEYPMTPGMTVLNAVAKAGGFSYRANQKKIFIRRAGENVENEVPLTVATSVLPGDTIRIVERYF